MSAFYQRMAETTLRLIAKFGQGVVLRYETPGEYDPEIGGSGSPVIIDRTASAILQDYSLKDSGIANQAGEQIQQGDKKILVAASDHPRPTLSSKVIDAAGETWKVVNVKEINPAGTALVYELQGRR